MRPAVEAAAAARWPGVPLVRVLKVPEEGEVAVVGTLYKEMALKPSILDEYTKDRALAAQLGEGLHWLGGARPGAGLLGCWGGEEALHCGWARARRAAFCTRALTGPAPRRAAPRRMQATRGSPAPTTGWCSRTRAPGWRSAGRASPRGAA
jgi:hypothetical protein